MDEEPGSQKLRQCCISIYCLGSAAREYLVYTLVVLVTVTSNVLKLSRMQDFVYADVVSDRVWSIHMVLLIM